jgi:hypothetical protein
MIEIQGREQFRNAAKRLRKERMGVRRCEAGAYFVVNKSKGQGSPYIVRFVRVEGKVFGGCTCEAGLPSDHSRRPVECKHLLAGILFHNAMNAARRAVRATPEAIPVFVDDDDPDLDINNWQ